MRYTVLLILSFLFVANSVLAQRTGWRNGGYGPGINLEDSLNVDFSVPERNGVIFSIDSQNVWQIGRSHKVYFDSAYGVMTDTVNSYSKGKLSFLELRMIMKFSGLTFLVGYEDLLLTFKHKYEFDSLGSFGYLAESYDNGKPGLTFTKILQQIYLGLTTFTMMIIQKRTLALKGGLITGHGLNFTGNGYYPPHRLY